MNSMKTTQYPTITDQNTCAGNVAMDISWVIYFNHAGIISSSHPIKMELRVVGTTLIVSPAATDKVYFVHHSD